MRHPALLACMLLALAPSLATAGDSQSVYEAPPALKAKDVLSKELRRGPHHEVKDPVLNDGFLNRYTVDTDFGRFEVESDALLRIRVNELRAIAELEELSKTEVFAKGLARSAAAPFTATYRLATHPVESAKAAPSGIKHLFGRVVHVGDKAVDAVKPGDEDEKGPEKEGTATTLADAALGVTGAERRWAQKLRVNPYTTNPMLRQRLRTVAKVDRAASLSEMLVPGVAVIGTMGTMHNLVYTKDINALKKANQQLIASWNIDPVAVDAFGKNGWYTPSRRTALIAALHGLEGVGGRDAFLLAAAGADSEVQTLFYVQAAKLLLGYHRNEHPISRLEADARLTYAVTSGSRHVWLVPVDYIFWTRELAAKARARKALHRDAVRELWLAGRVSKRAWRELVALGWTVEDRAARLLEPRKQQDKR